MVPTPEQIRAARDEVGLTPQKAAALLGMARMAWWRYEAGKRRLTPEQWAYWRHVAGIERIPFHRKVKSG